MSSSNKPSNKPPSIGTQSAPPQRRGFLVASAATVIGGIVGLVPFLSGLAVLLDPLRRKGASEQAIRVATLDALPADGLPHQFAVVAETRNDAWTRYRHEPIGSVHLVRKPGTTEVVALHATCPHAGCLVPFNAERKCFKCPCHNSAFALDGKRLDEKSPSPRDMDSLECEVRGNEVWVKFQDFQIATAEKKPKA